jgi:hypothetical protein
MVRFTAQHRVLTGSVFVASMLLCACSPSALPDKPLFDGLPSDYRAGTQLLQKRIEARFPAGSSAEALAMYLEGQQMKVARVNQSAEFRTGGFPCGSVVRITWQADAHRALKDVTALYIDSGCP